MIEEVYGKEHVDQHHHDTFYKAKYLRTTADERHMLAYPDGLPGGWCRHRKIHLIGHSQGSQTVRYLQFLMRIDYFGAENPECARCQEEGPACDKSDWIASLTCINSMFNGNVAPYSYGMCNEIHNFKKGSGAFHRLVPEIAKYLSIAMNVAVPS